MADTKPMIVNRDDYLDTRLPSFRAAEQSGLVRFDPVSRCVEVSELGIATLVGDYQRAECARMNRKYAGRAEYV